MLSLVLQVRTYDVVPISSSLGIVEFVPGTQPLKESICTFLTDEVSFFIYVNVLERCHAAIPQKKHPCHWIEVGLSDGSSHDALTCMQRQWESNSEEQQGRQKD